MPVGAHKMYFIMFFSLNSFPPSAPHVSVNRVSISSENGLSPIRSVPNYCQSVSPKQTTLEEDREFFKDFSSILCLWFEIQGSRTGNFFGWVLNTAIRHQAII